MFDQRTILWQESFLWQPIGNKLKRTIARMMAWKLKKKVDVDILSKAELIIVRLAQKASFPSIDQSKKGMLSRMDPFIDDDGIIRVGGRITNSTLPWKLSIQSSCQRSILC